MAQKKPVADNGAAENLDKIREILFGEQVRLHTERFDQLETLLRTQAAELRAEMAQRFDAVEKELRKAVGDQTKKLGAETDDRVAAINGLTTELEGTASSLGREITRVEKEAAKALDRAVRQLGKEKTDRKALSTIFTEFATRIGLAAEEDQGTRPR